MKAIGNEATTDVECPRELLDWFAALPTVEQHSNSGRSERCI